MGRGQRSKGVILDLQHGSLHGAEYSQMRPSAQLGCKFRALLRMLECQA
jgi:hypothetical protein